MKILVIGAASKPGQCLLKALSKTDHDVTGLVRVTSQAMMIEKFGVTPIVRDLTGDVSDLTEGFDAIMFVADSGGKKTKGVDYENLDRLIASALSHDVKRFIYVTSINSGKSIAEITSEMKTFYDECNEPVPERLLSLLHNPDYQAFHEMKARAEEKIKQSKMNYTIIKAGLQTQNEGSGKVDVIKGKLNQFGRLSNENLARCFLAVLENENTYRKMFTVFDGDTSIDEAFSSSLRGTK